MVDESWVHSLPENDFFKTYSGLSKISSGSFGVVMATRSSTSDEPVAVQMMPLRHNQLLNDFGSLL